ncbi:hypothetical protein EZV62_026428 [Acer yangbiense]|uniref:Gnk2-homologous domain-containing protein n=1 Tax=Acer yangbiense TaxID=1000413 RepID=A0A5C7GQR2_9ROSI|nr:hypothetical protein EZV62_026428 [Acer yangbiense]
MSSLKLSMIFVFLLFLSSSLFTFTDAADPTYLSHICSEKNFTRNSSYQSNINLLLSSLPSKANGSDRFSNATAGQDPDRVYGLFQCRGDVTTPTCKDCVAFVSKNATQLCPDQKGAIIWYAECLLRYSDSYIFSTAARNPGMYLMNDTYVTVDPSQFHEAMLGLMNEAETQAVNDPKKFATRKGNSTTSQPLYVLVQCTEDLSNDDCSGCLQESIAGLQSGRLGGSSLLPSCNSRYESYLFYNENMTSQPPPAPTPVTKPKAKRQFSSSIIIAIVAPITVTVVLSIAGYCFLTKRARKKYNTIPEEIGNNFTRNSTYKTNLNLLLSSLPSNANRSDGFSNTTTGQDPNRVYGLFQCRGDVTTTTCQDCVAFASTDANQRCPPEKRAVIWYDECLVHYSDSYIFSTAATSPGVTMWNTNNVTIEPSRFRQLMLSQMNEAATQAVNDPKKFATRKGNSTTSQTLYTLVQCTQDLSNTACLGCLQQAISSLPNNSIGGRKMFPSCICRYELYLFYNENLTLSTPPPALTPSPPSPETRPKGKSKISSSIIITIVAPVTAIAVLFVVGFCFLTRRARRKKYNSVPDEIGLETLERWNTNGKFSLQNTNGTDSGQSKSKSVPWSVDDASITEVHPR